MRKYSKLPFVLKKAVHRAAYEESRATYEQMCAEIFAWAADQMKADVSEERIVAELERRRMEAARTNALRHG